MNWLIIRLVENRRNTDDAAAAGTASGKTCVDHFRCHQDEHRYEKNQRGPVHFFDYFDPFPGKQNNRGSSGNCYDR